MHHSMSDTVLRRPLHWLFAPARPSRAPSREEDLLQLADDVESESPGLATELRGIALHEAAAASARPMPPPASRWRRAGEAVLRTLQAVGHRRAEEQIALLLKQWDITQPNLARELREALRRGD
jgi:hypothetical protein